MVSLKTTLITLTVLVARMTALILESPPYQLGHPESLVVGEAQSVLNLRCPIVGESPFRVEWLKDGERIDEDTWPRHVVRRSLRRGRGHVLRIRDLRIDEDSGRYMCKGINGFGSLTFNFTLVVRGIEHTNQLVNLDNKDPVVRVDEGANVTLKCPVLNPHGLHVRWLRRLQDNVGQLEHLGNQRSRAIVKLDDGHHYIHLRVGQGPWQLTSSVNELIGRTTEVFDVVRSFELRLFNLTSSAFYACLVLHDHIDRQVDINLFYVDVLSKRVERRGALDDRLQWLALLSVLFVLVLMISVVLMHLAMSGSTRRGKIDADILNKRSKLELANHSNLISPYHTSPLLLSNDPYVAYRHPIDQQQVQTPLIHPHPLRHHGVVVYGQHQLPFDLQTPAWSHNSTLDQ